MTEAMVVSLIGGTAGLLTASLLLGVLNQWKSHGHLAVSVDARVYLAALILTVLSALLFGMIPARDVSQSSPLQAMKSGPVDGMPLRRFTLRDLLLGGQIAICMLLVTASLVAVRGMVRMLHAPLGFQPQGATLAEMDLNEVEGGLPLEKKKAMIDAVRSIPGVTAAVTVSKVPFTGGLRGIPVFPPGTTEFTLNNSVLAPYQFTISPGYLEVAGTRLLRGRDVSWRDTTDTPYVAIVNATFARKMWADAHAIGQRFILLGRLREVVGVVEDGKYHEMQESPQPVVYLPLSQSKQGHTTFVVRSYRAQNEMAAELERTLSGLEPNAPITVQSWPNAIAGTFFPARAATVAVGVMGLLAAMLAVTGIFGTAAYNVSRRMKELGIRVALGARTKHVNSTAVGRPIILLGVGSLLGLLLGVFAKRLLEHVVYQANPLDPMVVLGAVLTMVLLGMAASAIPALRALAVDSSKLLREE
jgi:predicted permease